MCTDGVWNSQRTNLALPGSQHGALHTPSHSHSASLLFSSLFLCLSLACASPFLYLPLCPSLRRSFSPSCSLFFST
jgi:hypothetical protein